MRLLFEILTVALVIYGGWTSPFCDSVAKLVPWAGIPPSRVASLAAPAPDLREAGPNSGVLPPDRSISAAAPRDNSWMWQSTKLDRVSQEQKHGGASGGRHGH